MNAQCQVLQVPSSGNVCIGQIKAFTGNTFPLVFMLYNNGTVQGRIKTDSYDDASDFTFNYANVGLSNNISYQVLMVNGLITIAVNGVTNSLNVYSTDPRWATNTFYFKAGDYCQDNVGNDLEGAEDVMGIARTFAARPLEDDGPRLVDSELRAFNEIREVGLEKCLVCGRVSLGLPWPGRLGRHRRSGAVLHLGAGGD